MTSVRVPPRARRRPIVRTWHDLVLVAVGIAVLVLSALPVHEHSISSAETDVFRAINDHTVLPFMMVWVVMQLGNFIAVPVAAVVAVALRRWRLAIAILTAGVVAYYLAKVVKDIVVRGRPPSVLDEVHIRGSAALGRGYVSGHAAVVTLLAVLAWPYLGRRLRIVAAAVAAFVCLARMYVGAHLPLDVVGGAALGLAVAGLALLVFGRPAS